MSSWESRRPGSETGQISAKENELIKDKGQRSAIDHFTNLFTKLKLENVLTARISNIGDLLHSTAITDLAPTSLLFVTTISVPCSVKNNRPEPPAHYSTTSSRISVSSAQPSPFISTTGFAAPLRHQQQQSTHIPGRAPTITSHSSTTTPTQIRAPPCSCSLLASPQPIISHRITTEPSTISVFINPALPYWTTCISARCQIELQMRPFQTTTEHDAKLLVPSSSSFSVHEQHQQRHRPEFVIINSHHQSAPETTCSLVRYQVRTTVTTEPPREHSFRVQ